MKKTIVIGLLLFVHLYSAEIKKYNFKLIDGYIIENFPYEKQVDRNFCGPAVLKMVLEFYGIELGQRVIAKEVLDSRTGITSNSDLLYFIESKGLKGYPFEGELSLLKELVKEGIPVIVLQKPITKIDKGHYRIVIGFDNKRKLIIFQDSIVGERRFLNEDSFDKLWVLGNDKNRKRWSMAVSKETIKKLEGNPLKDINLATAYYKRKKWDESLELWISASLKLPNDSYPFYGASLTYLRKGDISSAIEWAEKSVKISPNDPLALDTLGLAYMEGGRLDEAVKIFGKAVSLAPDKDFIKSHLNQAKERIKFKEVLNERQENFIDSGVYCDVDFFPCCGYSNSRYF